MCVPVKAAAVECSDGATKAAHTVQWRQERGNKVPGSERTATVKEEG